MTTQLHLIIIIFAKAPYYAILGFTMSVRETVSAPLTLYLLNLRVKTVPLQAWRSPEGSRKLRFPDFVTTAQDGCRLLALRTGHLYPEEILLVLILLESESTPGP